MKKKNPYNSFYWKISVDELKKQIDGYHTLRFSETLRGSAISSILILTLLGTVLFLLIGISTVEETIYSLIFLVLFLLPLSYFIYRGSKIAHVLLLIYLVADLFLTLHFIVTEHPGATPVGTVFIHYLLFVAVLKSYLLELKRNALTYGTKLD